MTNTAGGVISTIDLDPWGGETNRSSNQALMSHRYTTYERDSNGGDEAQARRYQSRWTRFSQPDPSDGSYDLTDPQTFNRYSYVGNDPVNRVDPTGMFGENPFDDTLNRLSLVWLSSGLRGGGLRRPLPLDPGRETMPPLEDVIRAASDALANPACGGKLFPGPGGKLVELLNKLYKDGKIGYGPVRNSRGQRGLGVTTGSYGGNIITTRPDGTTYSEELEGNPRIRLDDTKPGSSNIHELALTLIHELGHAANRVRLGRSTIENDGYDTKEEIEASKRNIKKVEEACSDYVPRK